ncbi:Rtt105 [Kluyveromyces lactis]|nr:Rtt105 [Kluyveromyces lactis]
MNGIPSSPVHGRYHEEDSDSDLDNVQSNDGRADPNITDEILEERKLKYQRYKQPLSSSSPIRDSMRERRKGRLRELAREKKINSYRNDMEQFVMEQEYLRHLQDMQQEAQKHEIPPDEIDRLVEDEGEVVNSADEPALLNKPSTKNEPKQLDEDEELIRLIELQEEYESLMEQEQQELEETLSGFTI